MKKKTKRLMAFVLVFVVAFTMLVQASTPIHAQTGASNNCSHSWSVIKTVAPTATEQGYTVKKCSKCGQTTQTDYKPATGTTSSTQKTIDNAVNWIIKAFSTSGVRKTSGADGWTGNKYSCSSIISRGFIAAGVPLLKANNNHYFYANSIAKVYIKCGFTEVTKKVNLKTGAGLQKGDVLVNKGATHAGMYIGNYGGQKNIILDARQSHWTTKWNGQNYSWARVFRYTGK